MNVYTINKTQINGLSYLEIESPYNTAKALICLDRGAALESLSLKSKNIIADLAPLEYKNTYASSILFPFANRIKDGKYTYNNQEFKFDCNEGNLNNALHGLVYNKTFKLVDSDVSDNGARVVLKYHETKKEIGFPYLYTVTLIFTLRDNDFMLDMSVENNDTNDFPYTLGWHPYFICEDLSKSSLVFDSSKTIQFDDRMITKEVVSGNVTMPFEIKDHQLDNCYALNNGTVIFNTPGYKMRLESSAEENYFQMYTPPVANTIALEPVTGISDSFNNKMGLLELKSGTKNEVNWKITLE